MKKYLLIIASGFILASCQIPMEKDDAPKNYTEVKIETSRSVVIPQNGASPIAGLAPVEKPSREITFSKIGEKIEAKQGELINIIYDGVDPENTFIMYESTPDGYILELVEKNHTKTIEFTRQCQLFVVLNPDRTLLKIPAELRYEQIIWTPRADGSWEVRIGSQERGCASPALNDLQKLRTKDYNKQMPK